MPANNKRTSNDISLFNQYLEKIEKIPVASFNKEQKEIAKLIIKNTSEKDLDRVYSLIAQRVKTGFVFDSAPEVDHNCVALIEENKDLFIERESNAFALTGNVTIEHALIVGENYDALKNLCATYIDKNGNGLIDVIYIDPPYNTESAKDEGNDYKEEVLSSKFIYRDKFTRDGWLNMMNERLKLARKLLSDKGVIFISIDDSEQAYLKVLCDEVFGEENFVCGFPRVTKKGGKSSKAFAKNHDFIMGYCKNKDNDNDIFNPVAHNDAGFCNSDEYFDDRGFYKLAQTLDYSSLQYGKTMDYELNIKGELFIPGGSKEQQKLRHLGKHNTHDWVWRWSEDLVKFGLENGFIEIKNSGDRPRIYTKTYQNATIAKIGNCYKVVLKRRTKALSTLEFSENIYSNDNAKKEIDNILWEGCFEYVKPSVLIKKIAEIVASKDSIILDFFAGSGATGQAVMELNEEDGGNRKCILVTNNENNIALNITRERLYRVINGKGSKGEEIKWQYGKDKKSLTNNVVRVFEIKNYPLTLQDLDKAEKLTGKALTEFKKLNAEYKQGVEFDIYNELSALNPYKKEEVK